MKPFFSWAVRPSYLRPEYLNGIALRSTHASGAEKLRLFDKDDLPEEHMARYGLLNLFFCNEI